ncbi:MAG: hypothetical protein K0R46_1791 [Herbinix sp.]|nr:hypothetical protein [Herbinix sp.]
MADYKRMVSYMYQYENGVKKKNVGFARVEAKDGQCKITLHMQLLGQLDSIFPTYIIHRKHTDLELIYLGDTVLKNQVMDSKLATKESDIMDSGYPLSDMGGVLLFLYDNIFYATEWDDKPIVAAEVLEALKPKEKKEPKLSLEEELLIPKYKLPRGYKTIERMQQPDSYLRVAHTKSVAKTESVEAMHHQVAMDVEPKMADVEALLSTESVSAKSIGAESVGAESLSTESISAGAESNKAESLTQETASIYESQSVPGDAMERREEPTNEEDFDPQVVASIFEKHPRIYPFEDNEILICAKVEPNDIGLLPKELWALSNNSFLIHGYYCYHHLIFAKLKDRSGCRYILGVPGIYHNREKFMAKMFGFESFKPIRKRELRQGDFGYWYTPVCF